VYLSPPITMSAGCGFISLNSMSIDRPSSKRFDASI
jgi:hypothetical protein